MPDARRLLRGAASLAIAAVAACTSASPATSSEGTEQDAAADVMDATTGGGPDALPKAISGAAQKGPFVRGSSVTVQELDSTLTPTGRTFQVTTIDDEGDFAIPVNVNSRYVEVIASGYYFDELTNALSSGQLTLRALADLTSGATVDVTLLTSMSEPLVKNLVASGTSFAQATTQAESAVLSALGFSSSSLGASFSSVGLTGGSAANGEALAASLIIEQYARSLGSSEVAQLSQLLGQVGAATADGGDDATLAALHAALCLTIRSINAAAATVRTFLTSYYASLGASVTVPPFEQFLCGCGLLCDAGASDAAQEVGPLPTGCITPYSPGRVACGTSDCNVAEEFCCPNGTVGPLAMCITQGRGCGVSGGGTWCDGPEDCPAGQVCQIGGGVTQCSTMACATRIIAGNPGLACVCHSDADCPGGAPYCYEWIAGGVPVCQSAPPDASTVYGACSVDAGSPPSSTLSCGGSPCSVPSQVCCVTSAPTCASAAAGCSTGYTEQCDGPEDCNAGEVCCAGGSISGRPNTSFCTGQCASNFRNALTNIMCHVSTDCPASNPTCTTYQLDTMNFPSGGALKLCF